MATRIRLRRVGRKRQATFRIVVAGSMHARGGRVTETIGKYNPRTYPSYIEIDEKRALYWLRQGALASESVNSLFRQTGILKKLSEGAEGEGVVTIGDVGAKTILAERPSDKRAKKGKATVKAEAAAAEAEAAAAEAPAAEAAAEAEPAAEAETPEEAQPEEEKQVEES